MTKINNTKHITKKGVVKNNPKSNKIKIATKKGNIITFKKPIRSYNKSLNQILITKIQKRKSGMILVHSHGDVLFFDSMDDYINSIDWDWMKNRIR